MTTRDELQSRLYDRMETYFRPIATGDWRLNLARLTDVVQEVIAEELDTFRATYDQRGIDAAATSFNSAGLSGFMATGRSGAYGAVAKELQDRVTELRTGA